MLLVFKILGIILLAVLGILLLLIIFPWSINLYGDFDGYEIRGRGHSFFRFVTMRAEFDGKLKYRVAILWGLIPILRSKEKKKAAKPKNATKTKIATKPKNATKPKHTSVSKNETKQKSTGKSLSEKIDDFFSESNQKALKRLIQKTKKFLSSIYIDFKGTNVVYSLFDPAQTGILTGIFAQFPVLYGDDIKLSPDFVADSISIRGQIVLRGRIILFRVLKFGLSVFNDKDIMKLFKG
jgi:hypothetical protein